VASHTRCRACDSDGVSLRYRVKGYDLVACRACGSLTTAFSLSDQGAAAYYDHSYFHGGDYQDYEASEPYIRRNFEQMAERLRSLGPGGRLFEMGCAYGYFLDVAREHWEVAGQDISPAAVEKARARHGESVTCGDLLTTPLANHHYDWVVGWDMIEHVDAPRAYAARAFGLLRAGGSLALSTGDVGSRAARLLGRHWRLLTPPSHLTYFSRRGMERMLRDAGFSEVRFSTVGYERSLDFVAFRLLGEVLYERLVKRWSSLRGFLGARSFYVDLGDIMFVSAKKPAAVSAR